MKTIDLFAFDMNCVGHIQQGMWRHPRDRSDRYNTLAHWTSLARLLEDGRFAGLFLADVLGVYDVLGASPAAALRHAVQVPLNDPMLVIPAMAAVTTDLGFAVTANTSYEAPYLLARRLSTLDHLTGGRIGWNVVTGYLDSAARAMGEAAQRAHDDRYDVADEYLAFIYQLWEQSWADDAVVKDRAHDMFADPAKIRAARIAGKYLSMQGVHLCEPSPQRTPVLFQAGASARGQRFAATHAECVFVNATSRPAVAATVRDLRRQVAEAGRDPAHLKVYVGATVVTARTDSEARDRREEYERYASKRGALAHAAASLGLDFDAYGLDDAIGAVTSNAIRSNLDAARKAQPAFTTRGFLDRLQLGGRQTPIVGSGETVASEFEAWVAEADVDGFLFARTVTPECFESLIENVVPVLQRRGLQRTHYAPGTLRQKLFPAGTARLPSTHPARQPQP
jgi:FMN-dependent oxidoreductase (nitrilotriacetate monooxygenase family)